MGEAKAPRQRHDSDSDLSPPRASAKAAGKARHDSDADLSPPRKDKGVKRERHDSDADLSPPRRGGNDKVDANGEERMSSGLRSGLVSGAALKAEAAQVREERKAKLAAQSDAE